MSRFLPWWSRRVGKSRVRSCQTENSGESGWDSTVYLVKFLPYTWWNFYRPECSHHPLGWVHHLMPILFDFPLGFLFQGHCVFLHLVQYLIEGGLYCFFCMFSSFLRSMTSSWAFIIFLWGAHFVRGSVLQWSWGHYKKNLFYPWIITYRFFSYVNWIYLPKSW